MIDNRDILCYGAKLGDAIVEDNSPFVSDELKEISVRYIKKKGKITIIKTPKTTTEENLLNTYWKPLNAEMQSELLSECQNKEELDFYKYRLNLAKKCLVSWNLEGTPCDFEHFCKLDPKNGSELIDQYFKAIGL